VSPALDVWKTETSYEFSDVVFKTPARRTRANPAGGGQTNTAN